MAWKKGDEETAAEEAIYGSFFEDLLRALRGVPLLGQTGSTLKVLLFETDLGAKWGSRGLPQDLNFRETVSLVCFFSVFNRKFGTPFWAMLGVRCELTLWKG